MVWSAAMSGAKTTPTIIAFPTLLLLTLAGCFPILEAPSSGAILQCFSRSTCRQTTRLCCVLPAHLLRTWAISSIVEYSMAAKEEKQQQCVAVREMPHPAVLVCESILLSRIAFRAERSGADENRSASLEHFSSFSFISPASRCGNVLV